MKRKPGQCDLSEPSFDIQRGCSPHRHQQLLLWEATIERSSPAMADANSNNLPVPPRPTFKQEWSAYNRAQQNEKAQFQSLLHGLCQSIEEPPQTLGRPRVPMADIIFCAAVKVYSTVSGRRNTWELQQAKERGYISKAIHYNTLSKYMEREDLTICLKHLITQSAQPLNSVEVDFAVDSSGFSTGISQRWNQAKWGAVRIKYGDKQPNAVKVKDWVKLHIMCGVKTNIITSVEVTGAHSNDHHSFAPLVENTSQNFSIETVAADKAYSSYRNLQLVVSKDAMPFIAFKSNAKPQKQSPSVWKRMYHLYCYNRADFMRHYHKRSNVETTFSMIKAKFGDRLRSKTYPAQVNEVLCKVLCHNLCCLIQSMYELGIDPTLGEETTL